MIRVSITKQSNYPVAVAPIKKKLAGFLTENGIVSDAEVSVAMVGEKKMLEVGKKYLKDKKLHNVLSFTPGETKAPFVYPPGGVIYLGEIIVCYPLAVNEAKEENVLIAERVYDLIEHGALHLLGIHHKE
ncbi:MAG: putative rRNA maturation factor [Candidatus Woesebacteria bacterium GW2011_GWB1_45_5]|uniref:Putative rRNA maturation factor n=1 Tax=Candidatus Woesebacteria bacterium GW2011_GWB1_45_5 TaxID=1618581 RepID=A0A0G1MLB1_9BACT|nr:MAG: putative rRNA maturation factor [Candidatus Woesebacteria bacterium GW2011_GWB1_45_5]